jgi:peptidyl-prolyl cis-trans isomerase B (cyclophilin B)
MKSLVIKTCVLVSTVLLTNCFAGGGRQSVQALNNSTEASDSVQILIVTDFGDMTVLLYDNTPLHRDNFIKLVREGFYDGLLFHRVIKEFMIQGGDPNSRNAKPGERLGSGDQNYTVPAEFVPGNIHKRGALAAARQGDQFNPTRASSGSQFYLVHGRIFTDDQLDKVEMQFGPDYKMKEEVRQIYKTVGGAPHLDEAYTVFGEVVTGLDVIDKIAELETDRADRPKIDVKIKKMTVK